MRPQIKARLALLCIVSSILLIGGYISNALTISNVNVKTRAYLVATLESQEPSKGKVINWVEEVDLKNLDYLFEDYTGLKVFGIRIPPPWFYPGKQYLPKKPPETPWAYIKSRQWDLPYIIFNYYGWEAGFLWGRGGSKIYLCLFGCSIEIYDFRIWIT